MKVVDLHSDIFTDVAFRRENGERNVLERVHLPNLRKGKVAGLIGVIWTEPIFKDTLSRFIEILQYVLDDLNESSEIVVVTTPRDMMKAYKTNQFFLYLGIEGLTFMEKWRGNNKGEKLANSFKTLHEQSIRHAIFTWNEMNFLASGSGNKENIHSGVSPYGTKLIKKMIREKWIIDVSHLDKASFWDIVKQTNYPLLASHSNASALCPHERNLTDEQIKAIANTGGLIGVNAYGSFVHPTHPTIDTFIDHITYIVDLVGINHVGLGFDFADYLTAHNILSNAFNFTVGLEDATKIPCLIEKLGENGFTKKDIEKIAFGNFYHFMCHIHNWQEDER